ncbi:hypothetical protein KIN20_018856 [Parelaphostrongylus tenuis]|uniref:Secreted protein n=1 Tax=Parelaphostrongylus tenuis TaxID=148309 RepID=A0AAD5MQG5_PARTN|nr:hypothetical protein KIN20_018856 [Parelaphostrongylus tenuis]
MVVVWFLHYCVHLGSFSCFFSVDYRGTSQCEHSPAQSSCVKSKRELFPIKSRKVGRMGTSSVSGWLSCTQWPHSFHFCRSLHWSTFDNCWTHRWHTLLVAAITNYCTKIWLSLMLF